MLDEDDDARLYKVVVNHEEQFSIWFADRDPPAGWCAVGMTGSKKACLDLIETVWTDMRPLSLQKQMAEWAACPPEEVPSAPALGGATSGGDELVRRLGVDQVIRASLRPRTTSELFAAAWDRGVVHVLFPETGTELGVPIDRVRSNADALRAGHGSVRLVGELTLNFNRARFTGEIDVTRLEGRGKLEPLNDTMPTQR